MASEDEVEKDFTEDQAADEGASTRAKSQPMEAATELRNVTESEKRSCMPKQPSLGTGEQYWCDQWMKKYLPEAKTAS